jgi:hypothetical protein
VSGCRAWGYHRRNAGEEGDAQNSKGSRHIHCSVSFPVLACVAQLGDEHDERTHNDDCDSCCEFGIHDIASGVDETLRG